MSRGESPIIATSRQIQARHRRGALLDKVAGTLAVPPTDQ
jgi:hypothetical protein